MVLFNFFLKMHLSMGEANYCGLTANERVDF